MGEQGKTAFDPGFDISDGGLPEEKPVFPITPKKPSNEHILLYEVTAVSKQTFYIPEIHHPSISDNGFIQTCLAMRQIRGHPRHPSQSLTLLVNSACTGTYTLQAYYHARPTKKRLPILDSLFNLSLI